ncbi:MAG: stage II sporulation protein M [Candidatus Aenigmarchaeota archaeon]|nr:stage II sporulation protein M [Candidatus Aenigmarchaeota archaeon]
MVLEKLVSLKLAIRNPLVMIVYGAIISLACLFIASIIFESSIGLMTNLLITIASLPFMLNLIRYHEAKEEEVIERETSLLRRHSDVLKVYAAFSAGIVLALSLTYVLLPEETSYKLFKDQIDTINAIRGKATFADTFQAIFFNNVGVMFLSFLLSFLFGAGAIFIISWNASVLAAAIGSLAKTIGGVKALPVAALPFLPHGSLEFLAFFIGAIAGGLISVAITRRKSKNFWLIVFDSLKLLLISIIILGVAAFIETVSLAL